MPNVRRAEFSEVSSQHLIDTQAADVIGVEYSLPHVSAQIGPLTSK